MAECLCTVHPVCFSSSRRCCGSSLGDREGKPLWGQPCKPRKNEQRSSSNIYTSLGWKQGCQMQTILFSRFAFVLFSQNKLILSWMFSFWKEKENQRSSLWGVIFSYTSSDWAVIISVVSKPFVFRLLRFRPCSIIYYQINLCVTFKTSLVKDVLPNKHNHHIICHSRSQYHKTEAWRPIQEHWKDF